MGERDLADRVEQQGKMSIYLKKQSIEQTTQISIQRKDFPGTPFLKEMHGPAEKNIVSKEEMDYSGRVAV